MNEDSAGVYDRSVSDADMPRIAHLTSQAFGSSIVDSEAWLRSQGGGDLRVLRVGTQIAGALRVISMGQFFGGRSVPMTGIAAVSVAPEFRGRGLALNIMRQVVREMHDAGTALSTLYASTQTLYRQVGYEQAGSLCRVNIPLAQLASIPNLQRGGAWRHVPGDQWPSLRDCYQRMATPIDGMLDRGEYIWKRVWKWRDRQREVFAALDDHGRIEAVVGVGQTSKPNGRMELALGDLTFASVPALRRAAAFLVDYASMADEVNFTCATHHPLLAILPQQRFDLKVAEFWMMRVIRVNDALISRGYATAIDAELHLEITDELLPENAGRRVLRIQRGVADISPGGRGDLRLDVRALAPLYSGLMSAAQLEAIGWLDATTSNAARDATAVFAGASGPPSMTDFF